LTHSTTQVVSRFRLLRAWLLTTVAAVVIVIAMIVGLGRLALPYADQLRPWLEQALSERLDQPVSIERLEASWPRVLPNVTLQGVRVGRGDARIEMDTVLLEGRADRLLRGDRLPFNVVVLGLDLRLSQADSGDWAIQLGGRNEAARDARLPTLPGGNLILRDARLMIMPSAGLNLDLRISEAELLRQGARIQVRGVLGPWATRVTPLQFVLEGRFEQQQWLSVMGWLGTGDLFLSDWFTDPAEVSWWPAEQLGEQAYIDAEVFVSWDRHNGSRLDGHFEASSAAGELSGRWAAARVGRTTQLDVPTLQSDEQRLIEGLTLARGGDGWVMMADHLDLEGVHATLNPWLSNWGYWPETVTGAVQAVQLAINADQSVHHAEGVIERLGWRLPAPWPSLADLTLTLSQHGDRLVLEPSGAPRLNWPALMRAPIELDAIEGQLRWAPDSLEVVGLAVDSAVAAGRIDGWLDWVEARPFMDVLIQVDRVSATDPRPYLPHQRIPEPAMQWLDTALEWVEHASGEVVLHMPFGTPTEALTEAGFRADVAFSGAQVRPWLAWPAAEAVRGEVQFVGASLSGQVHSARVADVTVRVPAVGIANLSEPELAVSAALHQAEASEVSAVLASIPISGWRETFESLGWSGLINSQAELRWPMRRAEAWRLNGQLEFLGTTFQWLPAGVMAPDLRGVMAFDERGMKGLSLSAEARTGRGPVEFELDWTPPLTLAVAADLEVDQWLVNPRLSAWADRTLDGSSRWALQLQPGAQSSEWVLRTDLRGTALHGPEPLRKAADTEQVLEARWRSGDDETELSVTLEQALALGWRTQPEGQQWVLGVGQPQPEWPGVGGARVAAQLGTLAPAQWWVGDGASSDWRWPELGLDDIALSVEVAELQLPGLTPGPMRLEARSTAQDIEMQLDGEAVRGRLQWPLDVSAGRSLIADLEHVNLAPPRPVAPAWGEVLSPPGLFSGRHWPPMTVVIEDIDWAGLSLGRLRWVSYPTAEGLELDVLDLQAPQQRLQARGRLQARQGEVFTQLAGRLSGRGLSSVLTHAGYDFGIEAEQVALAFDLDWPGAPWDFHLTRLAGSLDLSARNGRIPEARPGAGRLVGLASFNALPRRLTLDFRDVFGSGLQFDNIQGQFRLGGGAASTDGVVIDAPAAKITLRGDTDLVARQYQQTIHVEPGLGSTLPVLGILAGGPVGAAAGLLLQTILDRPLREVSEVRYQVTGPWSDPQVELIAARVSDQDGELIVIDPVVIDPVDGSDDGNDHEADDLTPSTEP